LTNRNQKPTATFYEIALNVIGYQEDGEWVALALEMDLRGYGGTFQEALNDLDDHISMQVSFATQKENHDMIFHPAEAIYFQLFAQIREERLRSLGEIDADAEYQVAGIPLPSPHVIDSIKNSFSPING